MAADLRRSRMGFAIETAEGEKNYRMSADEREVTNRPCLGWTCTSAGTGCSTAAAAGSSRTA